MELISVQEVEKAIADYRQAEAKLAAFFGLKPVKATTPKRQKRTPKANGNGGAPTALQLNGKYMSLVRSLTVAEKSAVKKVRQESGVRKAIALAKRLAAK